MRRFQLAIMALLMVAASSAPARADAAPPDILCTVSARSSSNRKCVECEPSTCASTVPDDYRYECVPDEPDALQVWCEPYPNEGGCAAAQRSGVSGRTGQVLLVVLLLLVGFVFYRRSHTDK